MTHVKYISWTAQTDHAFTFPTSCISNYEFYVVCCLLLLYTTFVKRIIHKLMCSNVVCCLLLFYNVSNYLCSTSIIIVIVCIFVDFLLLFICNKKLFFLWKFQSFMTSIHNIVLLNQQNNIGYSFDNLFNMQQRHAVHIHGLHNYIKVNNKQAGVI